MNSTKSAIKWRMVWINAWILGMIYIWLSPACSPRQEGSSCEGGSEYYFGAEIDGVLCGYSVERVCPVKKEGKPVLEVRSDVNLKLSVLGAGVDMNFQIREEVDPLNERLLFNETRITTGNATIQATSIVQGDTILFKGNGVSDPRKIALTPDVILDIPLRYPYLYRDMIRGGAKEMKYRVYEPLPGEIVEKVFKTIGEEELIINDSVYHALVVEETDLSSMTKSKLWLNKEDGFEIKILVAGRHIYLTDRSVMNKIRIVDFDNVIFARVNKMIPDFQHMTYLKVSASIQTVGEEVTSTSLNRPGQYFMGEVSENFIDGVFEMQPLRYDGANAPPFPPDYNSNEEIRKYLKPELQIESDDPAIIARARSITKGSADSWEAAVRLSKWVAHNIKGAIPGGGSAINTYKMREAECGGHSRLLTAFCRAVGIPARMVIGCLYTTHYGGSFGQHAWTEIYMGEAGWIPVDATMFEYDYIDAGHIRLGEKATFQPNTMSIISYQIGKGIIKINEDNENQ
ncbi:MAG: transglutaminase-like domain-containing protein [Bacteroidales bacterium]|nr:transglutaminase-like domain-containing protein [Bacteroidales bacterium]